MKRVKITILKTTLDKELAEEYGVPGLTACPMMQKFATKPGKQFTSMYLPFLMEAVRFILEIGLINLA